MGMKDRNLHCLDCRFGKCLAENRIKLINDSSFRGGREIGFGQKIECELSPEDFLFDLLKVEETYRLFLKFIHTGVSPLRRRLENRHSRRLDRELVMHVRKNASDDNCSRMRVDEISFCPKHARIGNPMQVNRAIETGLGQIDREIWNLCAARNVGLHDLRTTGEECD